MFLLARELTGRADAAVHRRRGLRLHALPRAAGFSPAGARVGMDAGRACTALHRFCATRSTARARDLRCAPSCSRRYSNGYFLYFTAVPVACVVRARALALRRSLTAPARSADDCSGGHPRRAGARGGGLPARRREQGLTRIAGRHPAVFGCRSRPTPTSADARGRGATCCRSGRHEQELFPGLLDPAARNRGGLVGHSRRKGSVPASFDAIRLCCAAWARLYLFICVLALVLSLGPRPAAFGWQLPFPGPYAWMTAVVPGMDGLRVPARMATVVHLRFAVLGAYRLRSAHGARLGRKPAGCSPSWRRCVIALRGIRRAAACRGVPHGGMQADQPAYALAADATARAACSNCPSATPTLGDTPPVSHARARQPHRERLQRLRVGAAGLRRRPALHRARPHRR